MNRAFLLVLLFFLSLPLTAGFKPKTVRPKKPEQYQARATLGGVTVAADLLLEAKEQRDYFYKELTAANVVALRLAVFNQSGGEVVLPLDSLRLIGPEGKDLAVVAPEAVAKAVLDGMVVGERVAADSAPVGVRPSTPPTYGDPRSDPSDPRYDPRMDPNDPTYDPSDPRNRTAGRRPGYGPWSRPGVDVVLNPGAGGGSSADLSRFEKAMVEKDFNDKTHQPDPLVAGMARDRFIFFSLADRPPGPRGFILRLPPGRGIPGELVLRF
jgi:hypothetical protein